MIDNNLYHPWVKFFSGDGDLFLSYMYVKFQVTNSNILPISPEQILNEKAMKDTDLLNARLTKVQQDYESQLLSCDQLAAENTQKAAELKAKEDEINTLRQDTVRLTKMREAIQRKLRAVEDQKMEVEQQKETLKSQIAGLEKGVRKK